MTDNQNFQNAPEKNGVNHAFKKFGEDIPNGAIQALATASTGAIALEIAFLGYWAFGVETSKINWQIFSSLALIAFLAAFIFLAFAPFLVTSTTINRKKFEISRWSYGAGMLCLVFGLGFAVVPGLFSS